MYIFGVRYRQKCRGVRGGGRGRKNEETAVRSYNIHGSDWLAGVGGSGTGSDCIVCTKRVTSIIHILCVYSVYTVHIYNIIRVR